MHYRPALQVQKPDPGHRQISEGDVVTVCDGPPLAGRHFEQLSVRIVGQDDMPTVVQSGDTLPPTYLRARKRGSRNLSS